LEDTPAFVILNICKEPLEGVGTASGSLQETIYSHYP